MGGRQKGILPIILHVLQLYHRDLEIRQHKEHHKYKNALFLKRSIDTIPKLICVEISFLFQEYGKKTALKYGSLSLKTVMTSDENHHASSKKEKIRLMPSCVTFSRILRTAKK